MHHDFHMLFRIYRLKLIFAGATLLLLGVVASILADWLTEEQAPRLAIALVAGLSDALLVTGAIGVAVDFFTGRDKDAADAERTRAVLKETAPEFVDAVVRSFAVDSDDLRRVATPELLDGIARNVLSLRLGDRQFAEEIYADVRDQAIRAPERWYDVNVTVRLSTAEQPSPAAPPRFDVAVQWEYTVTPSHAVQRFACVSDRDEFYELTTEVPGTSTWFMTPRPGFDATSRECFELVAFSVDGENRPIRRSERKTGQTYSAVIGDDVVREARPVRISHVYRTITSKAGHRLFFEIPQPARGVSVQMDYTATDIAHMSVSDLVTSVQKPRISRLPQQVPAKVIDVDIPGWLLPRSGFTFVWTLASEERQVAPRPRPTGSSRAS